jgi:hypothetical protein
VLKHEGGAPLPFFTIRSSGVDLVEKRYIMTFVINRVQVTGKTGENPARTRHCIPDVVENATGETSPGRLGDG